MSGQVEARSSGAAPEPERAPLPRAPSQHSGAVPGDAPVVAQAAAPQPQRLPAPDAGAQQEPVLLHSYEQQIVSELVEEDGLVIIGAGLGLQRLLAVMLRLHYHTQEGVLLVLGMPSWQRESVAQELRRHDSAATPPVEITNEVPSLERVELYKAAGSCLVITPRILVVDMLTKRATPQQIAGLIILNAHRVTDSSGEAFAVRLYRSGNTRGYVRALSEHPTAFAGGFNKVEKIMRALYVRRLYLWPRFRDEMANVLERGRPQVVEWEQELPKTMLLIQAAVQEIIEALIKDLKRTHKVDCHGLDPESRSLSDTLKRQLEPVWNTVGWKTRQIVKDLRSLRDVQEHLFHCDAITFLAYLEGALQSLRLSAGPRSLWLFHDAAHTVYEQARRRVYVYRVGSRPSSNPTGAADTQANTGKATGAQGTRKRKAPAAQSGGGTANTSDVKTTGTRGRGTKAQRTGQQGVVGAGVGVSAAQGHVTDTHTAGPSSGVSGGVGGGVEAVLEEPPKWALLHKVLSEVQERRKTLRSAQVGQPDPLFVPPDPPAEPSPPPQHAQQGHNTGATSPDVIVLSDSDEEPPQQHPSHPSHTTQGGASGVADKDNSGGHVGVKEEQDTSAMKPPVLDSQGVDRCHTVGRACVMVVSRELHSCEQLEGAIQSGGRAVMQAAYEAYLLRMENAKKQRTRKVGRGGWGGGRGGRGNTGEDEEHPQQQWQGRVGGRGSRGGGTAGGVPSVSPALLRPDEASALQAEGARLAALKAGGKAGKGKRRGKAAAGKDKGHVKGTGNTQDTSAQGDGPSRANATTARAGSQQGDQPSAATGTSTGTGAGPSSKDGAGAGSEGTAAAAAVRSPLLDGVHFCALDAHCEGELWRLTPGTVILYEPDLAFLRQVHVLTYSEGVEQKLFIAAVDREVSVFSSLIEFKQHIVLPSGPPPTVPNQLLPRGAAALEADAWLDVYQQNALTRQGGRGAANKPTPRRVVVDVREFMSALPCVLYQQGFDLVPLTLEVGDYVLSPTMCVERKAVPDLIQSLASGRLYSQAEAMCKHYKTPVLLIEFDPNKNFGLQSPHELGDDIDAKTVGSRLTLLVLHFPRLRLVWSRSLHATADMFASFKSNMDEPEPLTAQAVGLPPEAVVTGKGAASEGSLNTSALELLKRLPGVTDVTARLIMNSVTSLADLATTPLEELEVIMHSQRNAKLLHDFLHAPCPKA